MLAFIGEEHSFLRVLIGECFLWRRENEERGEKWERVVRFGRSDVFDGLVKKDVCNEEEAIFEG